MPPRISIITPSLNQGNFIEETVKSVLLQDYSDVEHIIVDGGSNDDTFEKLKRYPHLTIIISKDKGQGSAVNNGLREASGEIIGWLNSDDTYLPGVFKDVVKMINPAKGVFIVMGRCAYIDEEGRFTGKEHPSSFVSHERIVEIWKGYEIPQPAVFFHRTVYEKCGELDENLYFALDYDLFLRYTKLFVIHRVNKLWATYRLHSSSKTMKISQGELLEKSLEISKRYWGQPSSFSYWKYLFSYLWYGGKLGVASLKRLNMAERFFRKKEFPPFLCNLFISFMLFPPIIFRYLILPRLRKGERGTFH